MSELKIAIDNLISIMDDNGELKAGCSFLVLTVKPVDSNNSESSISCEGDRGEFISALVKHSENDTQVGCLLREFAKQ